MEPIQTSRKRKKLILATSAGAIVVATVFGLFWFWSYLGSLPMPSGPPLILDVHSISPLHHPYQGLSRLNFRKLTEEDLPKNLKSPGYQACPLWLAGDLGASKVEPEEVPPDVQKASSNWRDKFDSNRLSCIKERKVLWYVVRSPLAASIRIKDASTLQAWIAATKGGDTTAGNFIKTVFEPLKEALNLQIVATDHGKIKNYLIEEAVSSALSADAMIHFDRWRKRKPYIFSFDSSKPSLAKDALYALALRSGWRSYKIKGSAIAIVEVDFQSNSLFVADYQGRSYVAQDLSGLINLFDEGEAKFTADNSVMSRPHETLSLTVRTSAWFDRLQTILFAEPTAELNASVDLHPRAEVPLAVSLPNQGIMASLGNKSSGHSWQVIPHDIFAAVSSVWLLPKTLTVASLQERVKNGVKTWDAQPKEALEITLVWDFDSDDDTSIPIKDAVAIILDRASSDRAWPIANLLKSTNVECNDGKTLIASASEKLRQRLLESCEGHNPSLASAHKIMSQDQIGLYLAPAQLITPLLSWGKAFEKLKELKTKTGDVNQEAADFHLKSMQNTIKAWQGMPAWFFTKDEQAKGLYLNGKPIRETL